MNNYLFIAPHPDDEVLGCGGYIAKMAKEHAVYILVATRGAKKLYDDKQVQNVRSEALRAHSVLGIKETFFFNFEAPFLDKYTIAEISVKISELIKKLSITHLFIPHRGDIHNDHEIINKASLVAARPVGRYSVKEIFTYETVSETEWALPNSNEIFMPDVFCNITDTFDSKIKAMKCYESQLREFPNPRSVENLEALAKYRGATVGFERAEAFELIRLVKD